MADVIGLLAIALVTLGGGLALLRIRIAAKAKRAARARFAPQAVADGIAATDQYIERVNAATTVEELRRLEREMGGEG
jgi:hypothetical protein